MRTYWETEKSLENEHVRIEFQWLMEDARDFMCDSLSTQMERNPDRNRIVCYDKDRGFPTCTVEVPKNLGNYYYRKMNHLDPHLLQSWMDYLYLDVCAYHNDFDAYSDAYKDMHNVRPHYTKRQWDIMVKEAQNLK